MRRLIISSTPTLLSRFGISPRFYSNSEEVKYEQEDFEEHSKRESSSSSSISQLRIDLAAVYRLTAHFGQEEGIDNHLSVLLPSSSDSDSCLFLQHPFGLHFSEVCASDLLTIDAFSGKVVHKGSRSLAEGSTGEPCATGFHLHSRVHLRNKSLGVRTANCLLHTHAPYSTALSMLAPPFNRLDESHQNHLRFRGATAYDDEYDGLILDSKEGDRLAEKVQPGDSIYVLGNHGVVAIGETIAMAWNSLYYFERCCMHQLIARQSGRPTKPILPRVKEDVEKYYPGKEEGYFAHFHLEALKRSILEKKCPEYKF